MQDSDDAEGDRVAGYRDAQKLKRGGAHLVREAGLPLTLNAVVHRQNLARLPAMIDQAVALGAGRLEVAHVQYYGWALANRAALLPTRAQLDAATATVEAARARLRGTLVIDYVVPDYHAALPKACMGGWGQRFLNVTPSGKVLPCHAAETLPGFTFPFGARHQPCRDLARFRCVQPLPRDVVDERALPVLRAPRDRLGRLPLPGLCADRRCRADRSGVQPRHRSRRAGRGDPGHGRRAAALRLPADRRRDLARPRKAAAGDLGIGAAMRHRTLVLATALCFAAGAASAAPLAIRRSRPEVFVHHGLTEEATPANEDGIANIGFIVGGDAVMVIDPGGSAVEGEELHEAVSRRHRSPDPLCRDDPCPSRPHLRRRAFKDDHPEFIGHAKLPGALAQRGDYYLRNLRRALGETAAGSEIVVPTRLVATTIEIDLGDRPVEIRAHGPAHTDNDLTVLDRRTSTLWMADLLFVERIPAIDGSIVGWVHELDEMMKQPASVRCPATAPSPSHGPKVPSPSCAICAPCSTARGSPSSKASTSAMHGTMSLWTSAAIGRSSMNTTRET